MTFYFENLDITTRKFMMEEVDYDISKNNLYNSPRLIPRGFEEYTNSLKRAIQEGDETTFANDLKNKGLIKSTELRRTKTGIKPVAIPKTAHQTLAEGEFNRFYIRGLCRKVIDDKKGQLQIYRAKQVSNPRTASQTKIGQIIDPAKLLTDLQNNIGVDTALGLPAGPNSGLCVRIIT